MLQYGKSAVATCLGSNCSEEHQFCKLLKDIWGKIKFGNYIILLEITNAHQRIKTLAEVVLQEEILAVSKLI